MKQPTIKITNMSKEWKGNKNSVAGQLGMSTVWHPEQRAAGDYYTTDPEAVKVLLKSKNVLWGGAKRLLLLGAGLRMRQYKQSTGDARLRPSGDKHRLAR